MTTVASDDEGRVNALAAALADVALGPEDREEAPLAETAFRLAAAVPQEPREPHIVLEALGRVAGIILAAAYDSSQDETVCAAVAETIRKTAAVGRAGLARMGACVSTECGHV